MKIVSLIHDLCFNRLIKDGYVIKNKDGNTLVFWNIVDVILLLFYVSVTFYTIWVFENPSTIALFLNFIVILRFCWGRILKKNYELDDYFRLHEHEVINAQDIFNRVRTKQIYINCSMAIAFAVGFVGYLILAYIDKEDIKEMVGMLMFIKLILSISSLVTIYDNFQEVIERLFLAKPSMFIRERSNKEEI